MPDDETLTPKAAGILTRAVRALLKTDPKAAAELVQDASVDALAKAGDLLTAGDTTGHPGYIHDLWDGPPDARPTVVATGGPGSTAAPGTIPVGPEQQASGAGAPRMEATYSRPHAQGGVQSATEQLGRDIMHTSKAVKALLDVANAHSLQIEIVKASMPTAESIEAAIAAAIAKAIPEVVKGVQEAMNKADDKKEDKKDEDGDKDKKPFGKSEEVEKVAALVTTAREELAKATEAAIDDRPKAAARHRENVAIALEDAKPLLAKATDETKAVYERIVKAMPAATVENQDIWPTTEEKTVGKADTTAPDLKAAVEAIGKAAEGMGMLTANVNQVLTAIGNSSRNPGGLPPVFSLAKAQPGDVDARMAEVRALAEKGEIAWSDVDAANDAVQRLRMASAGAGMPPAWAQQAMTRLPEKVQAIFGKAAA
jgi:hypothetical protein